MKVELTKEEASNVYVSLVSMAKSNQVDAIAMKILLNLSDKFAVKEEVVEPKDVKK